MRLREHEEMLEKVKNKISKCVRIKRGFFHFLRLLDFIGLTVSFFYMFLVFLVFRIKVRPFWKAVICEKGKHSELRRPSPLLALFPSWPRRCSALWWA